MQEILGLKQEQVNGILGTSELQERPDSTAAIRALAEKVLRS